MTTRENRWSDRTRLNNAITSSIPGKKIQQIVDIRVIQQCAAVGDLCENIAMLRFSYPALRRR
jgi:hypothetical protein